METREKQNLLTMIIIVAFLAIALIVGFIIYPEIIEQSHFDSYDNIIFITNIPIQKSVINVG